MKKRMCIPVMILTIDKVTAKATPKAMNTIISFFLIFPWLFSSTSSVKTQIAGSANTTTAPSMKPNTIRRRGLFLAIIPPRDLATGINADSTEKRNMMIPKYEYNNPMIIFVALTGGNLRIKKTETSANKAMGRRE